jgi:O-antigen biosynthesis protein
VQIARRPDGDGDRCCLRTSFSWSSQRILSGFVVDGSDSTRKFVVELLVDGLPVGTARADEYVHELAERDIGDGCYGFSFPLREELITGGLIGEARIANLGTLVGTPIVLSEPPGSGRHIAGPGQVRWLGGLRFSGWLAENANEQPMDVLVDGETIAPVEKSGWCHVGTDPETARAVRSFGIYLPEKYADGRAHELSVVTRNGGNLPGSPVAFMTFADGLASTLVGLGGSESERLRAELFDRLVPMSVPLSQYHAWHDRFPLPRARPMAMRAAVVMVGIGDTDITLQSLRRQTHAYWVAAKFPEAARPTDFEPGTVRAFLDSHAADCNFIVFGLSGMTLTETALERILAAFVKFDHACAVYGDLDIAGPDNTVWPMAFSAFDYERLLEQGYCGLFFALRRVAAERALASGATNLYRLFGSILDDGMTSARNIVHIPGSLAALPELDLAALRPALAAATRAHLRARASSAQVRAASGGIMPAVRIIRPADKMKTTIIIPTRNHRKLLQKCIESIQPAVKNRAVEIIVVDNGSSDTDTLEYLAAIDRNKVNVIRVSGPFNFARLNNLAASAATGDNLCLLNNDIQALDAHWLDEMLGRLAVSDVGAVGALLIWPSGVVQHGGVVLGSSFAATHAFNDRVVDDVGYGDLLCVAHECSAVTAACLVTRRSDFLAVGGMDEHRFPVNFNDVDYCLKLRAAGKRIVFTPHAKLLHLESASRGADKSADRRSRFERELQNLRTKWGKELIADSYYNPMLSLDPIPFSALAWPPREMSPRVVEMPIPVIAPPGI